ncbi:hypothetical protein HMPREF0091_11102 [Fannyhessea vaginae DSM 15829]|uniref:Uncharacterized protein n=1 Tax=Fannyhessea vaginae DSM 15829 TaxID=525256 RepID=F1T6Q1_9ACTN|nr:hypothetical protein HMPREF0091_11102 [Fannyhessea vaginae DSM 15829]
MSARTHINARNLYQVYYNCIVTCANTERIQEDALLRLCSDMKVRRIISMICGDIKNLV